MADPEEDAAVMREQLEYLLDHLADFGDDCGCSICLRYRVVRALLCQVFRSKQFGKGK